jgi:hypothetical protein
MEHSKFSIGKHLSNAFPIHDVLKGDAVSPTILHFYLQYATRELNGTHQLLIFADDVNLLGRNINIIRRKKLH